MEQFVIAFQDLIKFYQTVYVMELSFKISATNVLKNLTANGVVLLVNAQKDTFKYLENANLLKIR